MSARLVATSPDHGSAFATGAITDDAEVLDDRLEVEHLLDVTCDELTDLVDHKHEALTGPASLHQFVGALRERARRDVVPPLRRAAP